MLARERRATRRSVLCFCGRLVSAPRASRERQVGPDALSPGSRCGAVYIFRYIYILRQCTVLYCCTVLYTEMSCNSYCKKRRTVARLALRHGGRAVRPRREKAIGRGQREGEPVAVVPHLRVTTTSEGGGWVRRAPPRVRTKRGAPSFARAENPTAAVPFAFAPPFCSPSHRRSVRLRAATRELGRSRAPRERGHHRTYTRGTYLRR